VVEELDVLEVLEEASGPRSDACCGWWSPKIPIQSVGDHDPGRHDHRGGLDLPARRARRARRSRRAVPDLFHHDRHDRGRHARRARDRIPKMDL